MFHSLRNRKHRHRGEWVKITTISQSHQHLIKAPHAQFRVLIAKIEVCLVIS